jgi:hypothetical protein
VGADVDVAVNVAGGGSVTVRQGGSGYGSGSEWQLMGAVGGSGRGTE